MLPRRAGPSDRFLYKFYSLTRGGDPSRARLVALHGQASTAATLDFIAGSSLMLAEPRPRRHLAHVEGRAPPRLARFYILATRRVETKCCA